MNKIIFYFLLLVFNICALILIGISFLSGRSAGEEGTIAMSDTEAFLKHVLYVIIVSIVIGTLTFIIGFLLRNWFSIKVTALKKIVIGEFVLHLTGFLIAYAYIFLI